MNANVSPSPGLSWQSLTFVFLTVVGGFFGLKEPLNSDRPPEVPNSGQPSTASEKIPSRLWQDPFGTVEASRNRSPMLESKD